MKQGTILAFLRPAEKASATKTSDAKTIDNHLDSDTKDVKVSGVIVAKILRSNEEETIRHSDPRVTITEVCAWHIAQLQSITSTLFPVRYSEKFFKECLDPDRFSIVAFVALYNSKPVGWIRCRYECPANTDTNACKQLYIQTIGVLAPYRGLGLAKILLESAINQAVTSNFGVTSVYAHVWKHNEDALSWYDRQSFKQIMLLPQYYSRLRPAGAYIVRKDLDS